MLAQSCPNLCDPMDYSPPDFSIHGNYPGKITEVGCRFLLQIIFPTQGSNMHPLYLLHLADRFFTTEPFVKPKIHTYNF